VQLAIAAGDCDRAAAAARHVAIDRDRADRRVHVGHDEWFGR
jgi:hypothetical protein